MLGIDIQQILLHMLNFVILFGALYFLLYKPVKKFMDKRNDYYDEIDNQAESKLADAENAKNTYEAKLADVDNEIEKIKKDSMEIAQKEADKKRAEAREEAAAIIESAKIKAEREKEEIIRSANKEIRVIAEEAAQKLVIDGEDAYTSFINSFDTEESN